MDLLSSKSSKQAFTMVELIATIAIVAILVAVMVPAIGNFVQTSRQTADKQTLAVLNDALNRYKMQGGDISVLTSGANVANVLGYLQNAQGWGGVTHQFLQSGATYPASSISASGEGVTYQFTAYGSYGAAQPSYEDIAYGEITSDMPYGKGVGYLERGNTGSTSNITIQTTSGYLAYEVNGGATAIVAAGSSSWSKVPFPADATLRFWSCAGAADSAYSGDINFLACNSRGVTLLDISGIRAITTLDCSGNGLTTVDLSYASAVTRLYVNHNSLTSIDLTGCTSLERLYIYSNPSLTTLDVSNMPTLEWIKAYDCNLSSINMSGSSAIVLIELHRNNFSSIDLTDQVNLSQFSCPDNSFSSLDVSSGSSLTYLDVTGNNLSSITIGSQPNLSYLLLPNNNMNALDVTGLTGLMGIYYYDNPMVSSSSALDSFYSTLPPPSGGAGNLVEVAGNTGSDSGNGNTALVPSGWSFQ